MADKAPAPLDTPTDIKSNKAATVADALNAILADSYALYLKTKNFHWHVSGPHFRDYHLMLDDQAAQILGTTDQIAERVRKTGNTTLLADLFALYMKTKNFHWHVSGPHFRDYHLMLDEQAGQILAATDPVAERVRKLGGTTLRSVGHIGRLQRVSDNDADYVTPHDMLAELRDDNIQLTSRLRETHGLCDEHGDVATASLIENWIDESERRHWFLFETCRNALSGGH